MTESALTLRDLFESALALTGADRAAYLAANCSDPSLRAAVDQLLAADTAGAAQVLDRPFANLLGIIGDVEQDATLPAAGAQVGPFTLLDKLGEGGSSVVFRAEREQAGVRQVVALKLLRNGLYSRDEQMNFRHERLALSRLRHPGIARLIEGDVDDGGNPLHRARTDRRSADHQPRARSTPGPAPAPGLVRRCLPRGGSSTSRADRHRDLKPSNVMVTCDGEVKLLDFGIAKLLGNDTLADATRTQRRAMTPAYAAPEQFAQGAITTATDVYSLGVLLDELVTGSRREPGELRTPSSRIGVSPDPGALPGPPKSTRQQLRGDLDNIVLKATASEPEQRYASAGAFADDIERHLAGEPVAPHPPSTWYRTTSSSPATKAASLPPWLSR